MSTLCLSQPWHSPLAVRLPSAILGSQARISCSCDSILVAGSLYVSSYRDGGPIQVFICWESWFIERHEAGIYVTDNETLITEVFLSHNRWQYTWKGGRKFPARIELAVMTCTWGW